MSYFILDGISLISLSYAFGHGSSGKDLLRASGENVVVVLIQYRLGLMGTSHSISKQQHLTSIRGFLPGSEVAKDGVLNAGLRKLPS